MPSLETPDGKPVEVDPAQRERIAGSIASGSRVVAPIRMKSAGAPSAKSFFT